MNFINTLLHPIYAAQSSEYKYWGGLDEKLKGVGDATNELITVCQKYWFIPLLIAVAIAAGLIIAGKQGRLQAKGVLFWALVSVAVIMCASTIVAVLMGFFTPDAAYTAPSVLP